MDQEHGDFGIKGVLRLQGVLGFSGFRGLGI